MRHSITDFDSMAEFIAAARQCGAQINKYNDPVEDKREDLTDEEAEDVAREDPTLLWFEPHST